MNDLTTAQNEKAKADEALAKAEAALVEADKAHGVTQKRQADAQSALNIALADSQNDLDDLKVLRKSLEEAETQSADAGSHTAELRRQLKETRRQAQQAAEDLEQADCDHWRETWQDEVKQAVSAAQEHLSRAWAAGILAKDFQPGQFDSMLHRSFKEPAEQEARTLGESMRGAIP